jgi:mRNA-degrading endonuclease RelE of RelBE toxin-antitoxin system
MKIFLKIFSFIILIISQVYSQQFSTGSPEWLVDMFFVKSSFPEKADYYSGEMLNDINDPTIGDELEGKANVNFHQLKAGDYEIVFKVDVNQDEKIIDFYCFLTKNEHKWTINAVRTFLLPSFIYVIRDSLAQLKNLSSNDSTLFRSLILFTESDKQLMKYLEINLKDFQKLVSDFHDDLKDEANRYLILLGCNAIYADKKYPGCVFIQIQKLKEMECGFIYKPESALLPEISIKDFIYIEEVVANWYIYRKM